MNNLMIENLIEQATEYAVEQYGAQRLGERVWYPCVFEKKFAELIIKECIQVINNAAPYADGEIAETIISIVSDIEDHFGVN